jgi:hypothetical protein
MCASNQYHVVCATSRTQVPSAGWLYTNCTCPGFPSGRRRSQIYLWLHYAMAERSHMCLDAAARSIIRLVPYNPPHPASWSSVRALLVLSPVSRDFHDHQPLRSPTSGMGEDWFIRTVRFLLSSYATTSDSILRQGQKFLLSICRGDRGYERVLSS